MNWIVSKLHLPHHHFFSTRADTERSDYEVAMDRVLPLRQPERRLKKAFRESKSNKRALNIALKSARDAGLTRANCETVVEVQNHLSKAFGQAIDEVAPTLQLGTGVAFDVWDFGGQSVFHAMHTLLLHRLDTCMLVFCIPNLLKEENQEETLRYISHWLNTIALKSPEAPILLIGTHKDLVSDDGLRQAQERISSFLTEMALGLKVVQNIRQTPGGDWFFAVDNKSRTLGIGDPSDSTIGDIRDALKSVTMEDKRTVKDLRGNETEYVHLAVPSAVLLLLDTLRSRGKFGDDCKVPFCRLDQMAKTAAYLGLGSQRDDIRNLLRLLAGLGARGHVVSGRERRASRLESAVASECDDLHHTRAHRQPRPPLARLVARQACPPIV